MTSEGFCHLGKVKGKLMQKSTERFPLVSQRNVGAVNGSESFVVYLEFSSAIGKKHPQTD
ncbi:hypothetical protein RV13_GL004107 [Enterococcus raffinosus]|nr:hypothetical protein RV13_GL004107 [Enterococcus raffinosus]